MTHPKPAVFRHQLQQILTPSTTILLVVSLLRRSLFSEPHHGPLRRASA